MEFIVEFTYEQSDAHLVRSVWSRHIVVSASWLRKMEPLLSPQDYWSDPNPCSQHVLVEDGRLGVWMNKSPGMQVK